MKKITMTVNEFLAFRQLAEKMKIFFTYGIKKGMAEVIANKTELAAIGY